MANIAKKRARLEEVIAKLEEELQDSLTKKTSNVKEINVSRHTIKIAALRKELAALK